MESERFTKIAAPWSGEQEERDVGIGPWIMNGEFRYMGVTVSSLMPCPGTKHGERTILGDRCQDPPEKSGDE